jgi:rhodanese-related sulfurtransferase
MNDIDVTELKQRLDAGEQLNILDVREEWEFDEFNIHGKLIPLGNLPFELDQIDDWKDKEIIVHCKAGGRSHQAKKFMESKGFSKVRNLLGGMDAYKEL